MGGTRCVPAALPSSIPFYSILFYSIPSRPAGHSLAFPLGQHPRTRCAPSPFYPIYFYFRGQLSALRPGPLKPQRCDCCVWASLDWARLKPSQLNRAQERRACSGSVLPLFSPLFSPFFPPFFPTPPLPAHCFAAAPHRGHNSDPRGGDSGDKGGLPKRGPPPQKRGIGGGPIPSWRTKRAPSLPAESQKKIGIKSFGER